MTLQEKLYALRRQAGYSQEELAEKLGVSRQAVSKWERGESSPDINNVIAISQLYDVSVDEIISCIRGDNSVLYGSRKSSGISLKKPVCAESAGTENRDFVKMDIPDDGEIYPGGRPAAEQDILSNRQNTYNNVNTNINTAASNPPAQPQKKGFFGGKTQTQNSQNIGSGRAELCRKLKRFPFWALAIMVFFASMGIMYDHVYMRYLGFSAIICGLSIPLYYSIVKAIEKNDPIHFGYPFFIGIVCTFSMVYAEASYFGSQVIGAMFVFFGLSIPLYYTAALAYKKKNMKYFCFPVLVAMIYVMAVILIGDSAAVGLLWTFGLIPFYYIYSSKLDSLFFGHKNGSKHKLFSKK